VKLQFKKRRLIPVALAILVLVVGSGVAYAYWTSGGSGGGSGSAAAGVSVTVAQVATPTLAPMYPGDSPQTTSVTITNPSTTQLVHVTTVSISGVTTNNEATCKGSDNFSIGAPVTVAAAKQDIAASGSVTVPGPTIQFKNLVTNQDACKGVTVTLTYSVTGS
jgi:hypothetical protein